jgi:hypothetical protein
MKTDINNMVSVEDIAPKLYGGRHTVDKNEVRAAIAPARVQKTSKHRTVLRIVIGAGVIEDVRWQKGDRIEILFNNTQVLLRRKLSARYTLQCRGNKKLYQVAASLFPPMPYHDAKEAIGSQLVKHEIIEGNILLELPRKKRQ